MGVRLCVRVCGRVRAGACVRGCGVCSTPLVTNLGSLWEFRRYSYLRYCVTLDFSGCSE